MNCSDLFRCLAVIKPTTFGGAYTRSLLPEREQLPIRRVRCLECECTHAVLPAFLFGQVLYSTGTLAPYFELAQSQSLRPMTVWQQNLSDGPEDVSTLYRWLRRLASSLATLLPFLQQTLLELSTASELQAYQTAILRSSCEPHSTMALCRLSWWLAEQLLTVSSQLLESTPQISTVAFLNYFCWQKTGATLLSASAKSPP
jgi:hypothetical protein